MQYEMDHCGLIPVVADILLATLSNSLLGQETLLHNAYRRLFLPDEKCRVREETNNYLHLVPKLRKLLHAAMFNENACTLKDDTFLEAGEEYETPHDGICSL